MTVVVAPDRNVPSGPSLFLAGGITGCPDWQSQAVRVLDDSGLVLLNPRRENFPMTDPMAAETQIMWEHDMLRHADSVLFWFCAETIQPIVLYELGAWSMTDKKLYIGAHPEYPRRTDVVLQTRLVRPDVVIRHSLEALLASVYGP